ncbi:MAG: hypothetical protein LUI07_03965 [Lachnospiraceae bacterium]|nr:hypothetical protein [Lachnospiraceae bacterium]
MSAIEATVSMMQGMTETSRRKVLDYVKLVYSADIAPSLFALLSGDEIMEKLAVGRAQNEEGEDRWIRFYEYAVSKEKAALREELREACQDLAKKMSNN